MNKSKISLALLAALSVQLPSIAFAAESEEAEIQKPQSAKEKEAAKEAEKKKAEIEVITVGGMRSSEVAAINMKKFANSISDNLSAEEIGVLPDQSIAESLERLTGVTGNQDNGRSNTVSVRGMGGAYTLTTLNNREVVSSFGSRSVNLSLYPSASIRRAQVYKTARADGLEGGISGHVNMETFKPLEVDKNVRTFSATVNSNSLYKDITEGDKYGTNIDGMISQHIGDDFAFSVGAAFRDDIRYLEGIKNGDKVVGNHAWLPDRNGDGVGEYASTASVLNSKKFTIEQDAIFAAAQWQLTDDLLISADYLTSEYDYKQNVLTLSVPTFWGVDWLVPQDEVDVSDDNFLMSGVVRKPGGGMGKWDGSVLNNDKTDVFGINFAYQITEDFRAELDIAHSAADRFYSYRTASGNIDDAADHYIAFDANTSNYGLYYLGADFTGTAYDPDRNAINQRILENNLGDPSNFDFHSVNNSQNFMESAVSAVKLDFIWDVDLGPLHQIKFGYRRSQNTKDHLDDSEKYSKNPKNRTMTDEEWADAFGHLDFNALATKLKDENYRKLEYIQGFSDLYYVDVGDIIGSMPEFFANRTISDEDRFASYELEENTDAAYVQLAFAGDYYNGTFGLRYYSTELESTSYQSEFIVQEKINDETGEPIPGTFQLIVGEGADFVTSTHDYSGVLPSLNVNIIPADEFFIRIGAGQAMIRPSLGDVNNALKLKSNSDQEFDTEVNLQSKTLADAGNPYLDPIISNQVDVSFEYYPTQWDYYAIAGFYKDLDGLYQTGANYIPVEGAVDSEGYPISMPVTSEVKGEGGNVKGWEFSFRQDLGFISDYLKGLALSGNYMDFFHGAHQDYNIRNPGDNPLTIPTEIWYQPLGWIDSTYNVALTYDIGKSFSARINLNQQSYQATRDGQSYFTQWPSKNLSMNIRYKIIPSVTVFAQASNLLDETQTKGYLSGDHLGFAATDFVAQQSARGISYYAGVRVNF
ncbi:TonB-dependent receptor [Thalassotalea agarivorans]|uniref:TonB-dependent receptor n=1 Tax=Thalassotalea agarivorans TaxID=349064 RepID=A0A1I0C2E7_THASX|nr:TonB-dependent receptor [Thalassotalea agarivorans]SET12958.1 TonB-dependent receptor [Thalassotalea agarivorans]